MKEIKKIINLFFYKPHNAENFGEYLCQKVIKEMGYDLNCYFDGKPIPQQLDHILTGIGPFFNKKNYHMYFEGKCKKWYIWGTGVECVPLPNGESKIHNNILKDHCVITLLRGPLTKEYYGIEEDILLGDPAYLTSYFFKFPKENKKNVLITHHYDNSRKNMKEIDLELSCLMNNDGNGSIDDKFFTILKSIYNANIVLTSSMHVAVVAYTYGIPFAIISKRERDISTEWKWYDTLQNLGIINKIKVCNSVEEGYDWWNSIKDQIKPLTVEYQEKILNTFPFKSE